MPESVWPAGPVATPASRRGLAEVAAAVVDEQVVGHAVVADEEVEVAVVVDVREQRLEAVGRRHLEPGGRGVGHEPEVGRAAVAEEDGPLRVEAERAAGHAAGPMNGHSPLACSSALSWRR
jgi:hypothetical protein